MIFEVATEWFHSHHARLQSSDEIQVGVIVTGQALNCAGRRCKEPVFASVGLDIDSSGHGSAHVFPVAAL